MLIKTLAKNNYIIYKYNQQNRDGAETWCNG